VLAAGPTALSNLNLAYNGSSGTLDTRDNAEQTQDPAAFLCELLTSVGQPKSACTQIGKVLDGLKFPKPGKQGLASSQSSGPDPTLGGILRSGR
jgi:phospholipid/cholesterol/gamma-HCH transport system substrate-binding protein